MNKSWPKNGVVLVLCKDGRYWADLVNSDLGNAQEVLKDLQQQAEAKERKESLAKLCKAQVRRIVM